MERKMEYKKLKPDYTSYSAAKIITVIERKNK